MKIKAKKIEMSQIFSDTGVVVPVTLVKLVEPEKLESTVLNKSVVVIGKSKGRGYAGVMKRHGFHGGPATHGQSDRQRSPGSIGNRTTPGRVYRGKKMAGHFGNDNVTVKGLKIAEYNVENKMLKITGSIPGPRNGALQVIILD